MSEDRETVMTEQVQLWKDWMGLWEGTALRILGGEAAAMVALPPATAVSGTPNGSARRFSISSSSPICSPPIPCRTGWPICTAFRTMNENASNFTPSSSPMPSPPPIFLSPIPKWCAPPSNPMARILVKGLDNLLADIERGKGELSIRQSADGFVLGENIATAPGKVVFRNDLMELLQYDPVTETVYERPLLIFPPWINKFDILDLRPENSFIRWLTAQGYTVFVVSWANPDESQAELGFEDYMRDGIFAALEAVKDATGVADPNCVGDRIGGTLLAATLAYMAAKNDSRIHSATFWAAQTDFSEAGDLSVFVDEAQLEALQEQMKASGGLLKGSKMAGAFNMLRANDLIWSFVINNYMLGKQPMPFDLLYWNSDTTRMPEKLHLSYLRQCYRDNALALGKMMLGGVTLDLSKVTVPVYLQSAREDHIAPAKSVFKGAHLFGGPVRFIIAGSGHIAGVINPPAAKKYQYWTNDAKNKALDIEDWRQGATEHPGSWWTDWDKWLAKLSGEKNPGPQTRRRQAQSAGRCARNLCESESAAITLRVIAALSSSARKARQRLAREEDPYSKAMTG